MSVLLFRFKGTEENVPAAVFERFLLASTSVSALVAMTVKGVPTIAINRKELKDVSNAVQVMQNLEKLGKATDMGFFFDSPKSGTKLDNQQPYTICVNADNKPVVVAIVEGFDDNREQVDDYLAPKIQKMFTDEGGDLMRLYTQMSQKVFEREMTSFVGENGKVLLYFADGQSLFYGAPGSAGEDQPWGWATSSLTDEEQPTEEPAKEEEAPAEEEPKEPAKKELTEEERMQMIMDGKDPDEVVEEPAPKVDPKEAPRKPAAPPPPQQKKPVASTTPIKHPSSGTKDDTHQVITVPKDMREADVPKFVLQFGQKMPDGWQARHRKGELTITVPKTAMAEALAKGGLKASTAPAPKVDPKNVQTKHLPTATKPLPIPDGDATTKEGVNEFVEKFLPTVEVGKVDIKGAALHDPALLGGYEQDRDTILKRLGLQGIAQTFGWDQEAFIRAATEYENSAAFMADLAWAQHCELIKAYQQLYPAKEQQKTTVGPQANKSRHPVPQVHRRAG